MRVTGAAGGHKQYLSNKVMTCSEDPYTARPLVRLSLFFLSVVATGQFYIHCVICLTRLKDSVHDSDLICGRTKRS